MDTLKSIINKELKNKSIDFVVDDGILQTLAFDITRVADKKCTQYINDYKKSHDVKINSVEKEALRKSLLGYPCKNGLPAIEFTTDEKIHAVKTLEKGIDNKPQMTLSSVVSRIENNFLDQGTATWKEYVDYVHEIQSDESQLMILEVDPCISKEQIVNTIARDYDHLSNYHYCIIVFTGDASWHTIANVALNLEYLKKEDNFNVYNKRHKTKRIQEFKDFLENHPLIKTGQQTDKVIEEFYESIGYGFYFEDLFVGKDEKILVMQKVELDESPKKCPSCLEAIVRGNSYPRMMLKSFECQNPYCPSRSKIGRGKRYDLFGAKRQSLLERNSPLDNIDDAVYQRYRRDVLSEKMKIEDLVRLYSWDGDNVCIYGRGNLSDNVSGRSIEQREIMKDSTKTISHFNSLEKLFTVILSYVKKFEKKELSFETFGGSKITNDNSTYYISSLGQIYCGGVTSPPYYNAREYSQWSNLLLYLVDMMINAKGVYESLKDNTAYIYNIGDIVGQDNIYINSLMSQRRIMLGFYSVFIFELLGYTVEGNIIWDKGEVQSKRNSTSNHSSGYLKPVNAYEHCLVFAKGKIDCEGTRIEKIDTVKKINSKGENTYGHTAPYPIEIAELILPLVDQEGYIVEPFLGSGTTVIACEKNGFKSIGFELDNNYYNLAKKRISDFINKHNKTSEQEEVSERKNTGEKTDHQEFTLFDL